MPPGGATGHDGDPDDSRTAPWPGKIDRAALDEVFGDVLPDTTNDERDPGSGDGAYSEQWYRENRPPHHRD